MTAPADDRRAADAGFSIVEVLVVMIVVGLISAIAIPAFLNQRRAAFDQTVAADLGRYSTAAERLYDAVFAYPVTTVGFDLRNRGVPAFSPGNTFRAFTIESGPRAGYVVFGRNSSTENVWVRSSFSGGQPVETTLTALPEFPPVAGTYAVPGPITDVATGLVTPGVVAASWTTVAGLNWGAVKVADPTRATVMAFSDPTFTSVVKPVASATPVGNIYPYNPASFRVVDLESPVASRAVEVTTTAGPWGQGLIIYPRAPAATWPSAVPVAATGEAWTASAWVRADAGQGMAIGCRVQDSTTTQFVAQVNGAGSETAVATTGAWQRITFTCTSSASWVGKYVALQVFTPDTTPGKRYYVTAPQLNKGSVATPFDIG